MAEAGLRPALGRSVFAKLVAIMVALAVILVVTVGSVFWLTVLPGLHTARRVIEEYTQALAATGLDLETARRLADQLDLEIRYEGPDGTWVTDPGMPSIQELEGRPGGFYRFAVQGPRGGTYLVWWPLGQRLNVAHDRMVWLLLAFISGMVLVAYAVLRRALRPLRSLHEGVGRLAAGDLEVAVPSRSRDELGVLTEAFNRMVARVREMVRAREQLLLDVSHELRSPLTRMKVALALLPDGEKKLRMTADVAEMEAMITELLELERLRDGRGIRTERQDLVPVLRQVAASFGDRPPGVRVVSTPPEVGLDFDGDRMRTLLRNLIENAFKFSLPDSRPVAVSASEAGGEVVVRVTDDGPGIPESDLASLFEPFFRVDRSRSRKTGGYGLGLSICKRVVEAHGGSVTAENNPGRGATFVVRLPRR